MSLPRPEGREPALIRDDAGCLHAFPRQLLQNEPADLLVAHPRQQRGLQAEARGADCDVGGTAADGLAERPHILQPAADLLAVKIKRAASDRDEVERGSGHEILVNSVVI